MTIKNSAKGGAAIADRFRLDAPETKGRPVGKGATVAFIAAMLSLIVSGVLVYLLWQHWDFLMPA